MHVHVVHVLLPAPAHGLMGSSYNSVISTTKDVLQAANLAADRHEKMVSRNLSGSYLH
jgi:hypothetical protein